MNRFAWLTVRRMFSLLDYLCILAQLSLIVKGYFLIFRAENPPVPARHWRIFVRTYFLPKRIKLLYSGLTRVT